MSETSTIIDTTKDEPLHELYNKFVRASDNLEKAINDGSRKYGALVGAKTRMENNLFMYIMENYCDSEPLTVESSKEILAVYYRLEKGETIYFT